MIKHFSYKWATVRYLSGIIFFLASTGHALAQQKPPTPISVTISPTQGLSFGGFYEGSSGGTVTVNPDGSRTSSGDVVLINSGFIYSPAIFEMQAQAGTLISIMNGPDVILSGSHGGSLHMHIGTSNKGSSFIATVAAPGLNEIRIGGTLTVGSALANPAGSYSGTFSIIFIQQ
jgi:Domain of unknown function (DUF4402)